MAIKELEIVLGTACEPIDKRWVSFTIDSDSLPAETAHLALTQSIYELLDTANPNEYAAVSAQHITNTYKLDVKSIRSEPVDADAIKDGVFAALETPRVDIHDPEHDYMLLFDERVVFVTEQRFQTQQDFNTRRSHQFIYNHPTSLNPRYSRAMINMSKAKLILDPFCGVGGILIEGAQAGNTMVGGDYSEEMIARARSNIASFNADIPLHVRDAREWDERVGAIVTDLPYGKNSSISEDPNSLYTGFFKHASTLTDRMVVGSLKQHDVAGIAISNGWKVQGQFDIYVHKSMTRTIHIVTR